MGEVTGKKSLGFDDYIKYFSDNRPPINPNGVRIAANYFRVVEDNTRSQIAPLTGDEERIDSTLEWVLASYYSPAVVQIRPPEAEAILPANNPRLSGLKLASAVLYELAEVKIFQPQDTAAIGRYEGMVKFIQDKHELTRAEIDSYYHDAIRAEVIDVIETQFSRIIFLLQNASTSHNAVLIHKPKTGQYVLSYSGYYVNGTKEITASSLPALANEMRKNKTDFDEAGISSMENNALRMPGVFYGADALKLMTEAFVTFYTTPEDGYKTLLGIYARIIRGGNRAGRSAFQNTIPAILPKEISDKLLEPTQYISSLSSYARYPADPRYEVFDRR